ncbi:hypothetical protein SeGA_0131, partial [Salmonella enterica subsp. enterica serovar Gaminara str. A4-567]
MKKPHMVAVLSGKAAQVSIMARARHAVLLNQ